MIGLVENAMLARIKEASANHAIPYAFRTLETWPKDFVEYLEREALQFPACWSTFGGAHKGERVSRGRWAMASSFGLVVAAQNLRNEQARRHGGTAAEPGSYQLAKDVLRLLGDQTFGLDVLPFLPVSILPVETHDIPKLAQISMYAVSFETTLYFETQPNVAGAPDAAPLQRLHANWDPAPYGHVDADAATAGVQIPDDPHAIVTSNVELEQ